MTDRTATRPSSAPRRGCRPAAAFAALGLLSALAAAPARAWGPGGHQTIGAVADALLAGTPAGAKVKALLGGTLQGAAVWADCARSVSLDAAGWRYHAKDAAGHTHPECAPFETDTGQAALVAYVKRNASRCGLHVGYDKCRHEAYHVVDLSIRRTAYDDGAPGTGPTDLVHAVRAAVAVLQGQPSPAPIAIAGKREAIRLLAHLVGDLHQPLHVGAVYLDAQGGIVDPADGAQAKAARTSGGNALAFEGNDLHHAWDSVPGSLLAAATKPAGLAAARAVAATPGAPADWPAAWATDTLQQAVKAFDGLRYDPRQGSQWPASATEPAYRQAREGVQRQQIAKAGARLAALLKATVN